MADRAEIAAFRFGYGLAKTPAAESSRAPSVLALSAPDRAATLWPSVTSAEALAATRVLRAAREADKTASEATAKAARKETNAAFKAIRALSTKGARAAFARAMGGDGLRERLTRFWTDHFTVTPRARAEIVWPATLVEDAIRPNLTGPFATMLKAVATHPAMLIYLDQSRSIGPASKRGTKAGKGLNENYARELLELHTLGVGASYTQEDVRQLAELLTGLTFNDKVGSGFDPARVEPGPETVLGKSYDGKGMVPINHVLEDLAVHPQTARHLAQKLAVHFVSDTPDPDLVDALAQAWMASGGDLAIVTEALLDHPASWQSEPLKARQPFDYIVAALRSLGVSADALYQMSDRDFERQILRPMADMGQPWHAVPGPNGWPEEAAAWITPAGLSARIEWAISAPEALLSALPDPRDYAKTALGSRATERLIWAVAASESQREGLGLVLASPEFNRR